MGMHITLIQPAVGFKADGTAYPASWRMEPLGIAMLAGLTPPDVQRTFIDDRFESIDYAAPTDLVCITVETYTACRAYQISAEFRKRGVPVVLGGFHPTLVPDEAAQYADSIVLGEAEPVWEELLHDAAAGRLQPRYQAERPALNGWLPDRSIFGARRYGRVSLVETSRGCAFHCEFCSICRFFRHRCLERPVDEVAREVQSLRKPVFFVDDNIGADPARLRELCTALLPLKHPWIGQASLHIASDTALLDLMRRSGCIGVLVGFESLDAQTLADMGKSVNRSALDYPAAIKAFRDHGLAIYATFVFGYDQDTPATFERVYTFALQQKFFFTAFNHLVPFPGTPLYDRLASEDRLLHPQWWLARDIRFGDVVFQPAQMSAHALASLCESYRRRFYSIPSVFRRGLDFRANCRTPYRSAIYLGQNLLQQREVDRRQGLPFGEPGMTI
jgi:radical SAM superfamily enzyme YgiQ (UPF0313 family)